MISAELERLLEPLERFEAIRRKVVRMGDRLCDLSYANPYGGAQAEAKAALRDALEDGRALGLQYAPFGGQTLARRAVADALRASHGLPFTFDDVVLAPGAMAALHLALHTAGSPGDEVVIPVPCWLDYPLFARSTGRVPVHVPLSPGTFDLDVDAIAAAITERTCAILLCNPHNPTGRSYDAGVLARLVTVVAEAEQRLGCQVTFIADETHRDFTRPGSYASVAAVADRTVVVYSFGKYHLMQGQRLGYAATVPSHPARESVAREMVRWTRIAGLVTPTALMQRALPRLLELRYELGWVDAWRERFLRELAAMGYEVVVPEATLFVYVGTPQEYDDFTFVTQLASSGVLVLPAPVFHHQGYFRLSLTGSERMMEQALGVFARFAPP